MSSFFLSMGFLNFMGSITVIIVTSLSFLSTKAKENHPTAKWFIYGSSLVLMALGTKIFVDTYRILYLYESLILDAGFAFFSIILSFPMNFIYRKYYTKKQLFLIIGVQLIVLFISLIVSYLLPRYFGLF